MATRAARKDKLSGSANLIGLGLLLVVLLSVGYQPLAQLVVGLYYPAGNLANPASLPEWVYEVYLLLYAPVTLLPPFALLWGGGGSRGLKVPMGRSALPVWVLLPLFLGAVIAANAVISLLRALVSGALGLPDAAPMALPQTGGGLALRYLSACLMPAVFEELFFRGAVQGLLRPFGRRFAIVAASVPFVLMHTSVWELPVVLVLSLLLGYVAESCGVVWPCMLLHLCNNAFVLTLELAQQRMAGTAALALAMWMVLLFAALVVGAVYTIRQRKLGKKLRLPKDAARLKQKKPGRWARLLQAPCFALALALLAALLAWQLFW